MKLRFLLWPHVVALFAGCQTSCAAPVAPAMRPAVVVPPIMEVHGQRPRPAKRLVLSTAEVQRLRVMLEQVERDLTQNVLPFWTRNTWDETGGGFITHLNRRGERTGVTDKYLVMQARMVWTLAAAHRLRSKLPIPQEIPALDLSRRGAHFLVEKMWDNQFGGFFFAVKQDGTRLDDTKHLYGQEFAIYALAEYALATDDAAEKRWAIDWAQKTWQLCRAKTRDGERGYLEDFSREWKFLPQNIGGGHSNGKSLNTHMHLMEALTVLYQAAPSRELRGDLKQLTDLLLQRTLHPGGAAMEPFSFDWKPLPTRAGQLTTSYGHNVEFAWLLLDTFDTLREPRDRYRRQVLGLLDHSLRFGVDTQRGGIAAYGPLSGDVVTAEAFGPGRLEKEWWQQAEACVAWVQAFSWTGDRKYLHALEKQWNHIQQFQIDHEGGDWFPKTDWNSGAPLDANADKGSAWKTSYHNGRALMRTALALRDILAPQIKK
jgi:mannobiose 2-epimerase